jgi:hypothetical protein
MGLEFSDRAFLLPNGKRMLVELFGVRIIDKSGNTILESSCKKEAWFDRSLNHSDRRLLSALKIRR